MTNTYIIHYNNGSILTLTASNLSGAKAQVADHANMVDRIERVYLHGNRSVAPW